MRSLNQSSQSTTGYWPLAPRIISLARSSEKQYLRPARGRVLSAAAVLLPVLNSYFSQLVTKCNDIKVKAVMADLWAWLYLHLCKYLYRSPDCVKMGASVHAFQSAVKMKYHVQLSQLCGSPLISLSAKPIRDSKKSNVLIVR